jgi:hypothetical protein
MASSISSSIDGVASFLLTIDKKITNLLKINENETLKSIQLQIPNLRKTLHSLNSQLHHPGKALDEVKCKDGTLLSLSVVVVVTYSKTLKLLRSAIKSVKHKDDKKGKGLFERHYEPVTETDLLLFEAKLRFLDEALQVIKQLITMYVPSLCPDHVTDTSSSHLATIGKTHNKHEEKQHLKALGEILNKVQVSLQTQESLKAGSTANDYGKICTHIIHLAHDEGRLAETELSGFAPLSPLVEVKTNITLLPSKTNISALGL